MRLIVLNLLLLVVSTSCTGDEFESIFSQIYRIIWQKEKKCSFNLKDSIESATKINGALPQIYALYDPSEFKQEIVEMVHHFDIGTQNSGRLLERIEVNDSSWTDLIDRIHQLKVYVENLLKWYNFLEKLRDDYNFQKTEKLPSSFANKIMGARFFGNDTKPVKAFKFAKSISQLDPHRFKDIQEAYKAIQYMDLNKHKLDLLQTVWNNLRQSVLMECQNDTLMVSGYNVLLADVVSKDCFKTAKYLKVFALNKIFFDMDLIKPSLDMAVVSPNWETIG